MCSRGDEVIVCYFDLLHASLHLHVSTSARIAYCLPQKKVHDRGVNSKPKCSIHKKERPVQEAGGSTPKAHPRDSMPYPLPIALSFQSPLIYCHCIVFTELPFGPKKQSRSHWAAQLAGQRTEEGPTSGRSGAWPRMCAPAGGWSTRGGV